MQKAGLLDDYARMGRVAETTRTLLGLVLEQREPTPAQWERLNTTLSHLTDVREGFLLSVRTGSGEPRELQDLVRYTLAGMDWSWLEAMGLQLLPDGSVYVPRLQLLSFAHSYLTMALLPRLPRQEITFPQPRSYADIPVPRRPGEILERIEELEQVLTRLQLNAGAEGFRGDAWRRTYGFFETSAWLVRDHMRLFRRHDD